MKTRIIGVAFAMLLIGGALFASGSKEDSDMMDGGMEKSSSMSDQGMMQDEADSGSMMSSGAMILDFTTLDEAAAYAESGPVVLLFLDESSQSDMAVKNLNDNFGNIPGNTTIFTLSLGSTDLDQRFGVTEGGTYVLIDSMAEAKNVWVGGDFEHFIHMSAMTEGSM